jgi:hypothetical protein
MRRYASLARLVRREKQRQPGDLLGRAEPAHRLAVDEGLAHSLERPSEQALQGRSGVRMERPPVAENDLFWLP